jgi:hypothetical protein
MYTLLIDQRVKRRGQKKRAIALSAFDFFALNNEEKEKRCILSATYLPPVRALVPLRTFLIHLTTTKIIKRYKVQIIYIHFRLVLSSENELMSLFSPMIVFVLRRVDIDHL